MDPVTIAAIVSGGEAIAALIQKLVAARDDDAAAVLADLKVELAKMNASLEEGGAVDQAFAADDAKLQAAIDAADKAVGDGSGSTGAPTGSKP
jgi:uncharacterized iron-regulated protein